MQPGGCGVKSRAPADGVGVSTFRKCVKDGERRRKQSGGLVSSPSEEFTHEFVSDLWETLSKHPTLSGNVSKLMICCVLGSQTRELY